MNFISAGVVVYKSKYLLIVVFLIIAGILFITKEYFGLFRFSLMDWIKGKRK